MKTMKKLLFCALILQFVGNMSYVAAMETSSIQEEINIKQDMPNVYAIATNLGDMRAANILLEIIDKQMLLIDPRLREPIIIDENKLSPSRVQILKETMQSLPPSIGNQLMRAFQETGIQLKPMAQYFETLFQLSEEHQLQLISLATKFPETVEYTLRASFLKQNVLNLAEIASLNYREINELRKNNEEKLKLYFQLEETLLKIPRARKMVISLKKIHAQKLAEAQDNFFKSWTATHKFNGLQYEKLKIAIYAILIESKENAEKKLLQQEQQAKRISPPRPKAYSGIPLEPQPEEPERALEEDGPLSYQFGAMRIKNPKELPPITPSELATFSQVPESAWKENKEGTAITAMVDKYNRTLEVNGFPPTITEPALLDACNTPQLTIDKVTVTYFNLNQESECTQELTYVESIKAKKENEHHTDHSSFTDWVHHSLPHCPGVQNYGYSSTDLDGSRKYWRPAEIRYEVTTEDNASITLRELGCLEIFTNPEGLVYHYCFKNINQLQGMPFIATFKDFLIQHDDGPLKGESDRTLIDRILESRLMILNITARMINQ